MLRHAWANYRDESFVLQYLSPAMIRRFHLFHVSDDSTKPALRVEAIHDDVIPANLRLAEAELMLGGKIGRELTLKRALSKLEGYDVRSLIKYQR